MCRAIVKIAFLLCLKQNIILFIKVGGWFKPAAYCVWVGWQKGGNVKTKMNTNPSHPPGVGLAFGQGGGVRAAPVIFPISSPPPSADE